ncbi:hypothetical protein AAFF_G00387580 [Aldrovandia affinis]|uniref:Uncharacterized protein n=1 Tax=Aldrovandia affinis TaxID=143900 RepID=A0AAD7SEP2_9TELE|nr:hypothetical protein AAFF_G00387580 [Aldrovandia affinis]
MDVSDLRAKSAHRYRVSLWRVAVEREADADALSQEPLIWCPGDSKDPPALLSSLPEPDSSRPTGRKLKTGRGEEVAEVELFLVACCPLGTSAALLGLHLWTSARDETERATIIRAVTDASASDPF